MPEHGEILKRFANDTATHEMKVLHDDGLYRHLRFQKPGTSCYWFELITIPGSLIYRGDGQSYVFARLTDMFEFFRSPDGHINPGYWAEKLTSDDSRVKRYSRCLFEAQAAEDLKAAEEQYPGVTAAWKDSVDWEYDLEYEENAHRAANTFTYRPADWPKDDPRDGFHFYAAWEWDTRDWDWWFLWTLHAIVWGINQYDAARSVTT